MQPHFPGYPYFILGGWFINQWINNPVMALSVFNTLAALSSAIPMFLLAHRLTGSGMKSLLLPALVLSSPYIWLMSSRPMSECAGMALLWWFLWSIRFAMDRPSSMLRHGLALLMFGFLMGTRLSFFPYGSSSSAALVFAMAAGGERLAEMAQTRRFCLGGGAVSADLGSWIGAFRRNPSWVSGSSP